MADQQLGEITGELRQVGQRITGLEGGLADLRRENAQDHAAVVQQLTAMGERFNDELKRKADQADLEDVRAESRASTSQVRGWLFTLTIAVAGAALVNVLLNFTGGS